MSTAISDWDNEYARLARAASQMRTQGMNTGAADAANLQQGLQRLDQALVSGSLSSVLQPAEIQRRRRLIQHLQQNSGGGVDLLSSPAPGLTSNNNMQQPSSQMTMAIQQSPEWLRGLLMMLPGTRTMRGVLTKPPQRKWL